MDKMIVNLKNCFGIGNLNETFDFSEDNIFQIYASNGVMKTSFSTSFKLYSEGRETEIIDRVYKTTRPSSFEIKDETGKAVKKENIMVIAPFNKLFYDEEKVSLLLLDGQLKIRYKTIFDNVNSKKNDLVSAISELSGIKTTSFDEEIKSTFELPGDIFNNLLIIESELSKIPISSIKNFSGIPYSKIMDEKVQAFLSIPDNSKSLDEYIKKYDELVAESDIFKKDLFNHNNAELVNKSLDDNNFFKADHSINLETSKGPITIRNPLELSRIISHVKAKIFNTPELVQKFEEFDKKLQKNKELREFRDIIEKNPGLLIELRDIKKFRANIWYYFLSLEIDKLRQLLEEFNKSKKEALDILNEAKKKDTIWENVVDIFNERFNVPFTLKIKNKEESITGLSRPSIYFLYSDDLKSSAIEIGKDEIWSILSMGEQRALYLLNIIFEIKVREINDEMHLLIFDDVADSFDYKNKYAIVEYLRDLKENKNFKILLLTHNYDFHRTTRSRLGVLRRNFKIANKSNDRSITLQEEFFQSKNPFLVWKENCDTDNVKFIALIPFVRNLIEYSLGTDENEYKTLTSVLHLKDETSQINVKVVKNILEKYGVKKIDSKYDSINIFEFIKGEIESRISKGEVSEKELETKITLSMGIRLIAERFMISRIANKDYVDSITSSQTYVLFKKVCKDGLVTNDEGKLLDKVNMLTAENIHINAFMYEPIIDLGIDYLVELYSSVITLK